MISLGKIPLLPSIHGGFWMMANEGLYIVQGLEDSRIFWHTSGDIEEDMALLIKYQKY